LAQPAEGGEGPEAGVLVVVVGLRDAAGVLALVAGACCCSGAATGTAAATGAGWMEPSSTSSRPATMRTSFSLTLLILPSVILTMEFAVSLPAN